MLKGRSSATRSGEAAASSGVVKPSGPVQITVGAGHVHVRPKARPKQHPSEAFPGSTVAAQRPRINPPNEEFSKAAATKKPTVTQLALN